MREPLRCNSLPTAHILCHALFPAVSMRNVMEVGCRCESLGGEVQTCSGPRKGSSPTQASRQSPQLTQVGLIRCTLVGTPALFPSPSLLASLHFLLIGTSMLVPRHVARGVDQVLPSCFAFAFPGWIKSFFVGTSETCRVCKSGDSWRCNSFLSTKKGRERISYDAKNR